MLTDLDPMLLIDFYKADHRRQYPRGTTLVYSNFTPRKSRVEGVKHMTFFGLQALVKEYLIKRFNENFFHRPKREVLDNYRRRMNNGLMKSDFPIEHVEALHDLGFLPLMIKAVPEGTNVPLGCPAMTLYNTRQEFFWLTNYIETLLSALLWKPCTSATTAGVFRGIFEKHAEETGAPMEFIDFQGHDFSMRGMSGIEDAVMSGAAHLLHFRGTDTVPAIDFLERYYGANSDEELVGCSVAATEHSVMCANGQDGELETLERLLDLYPEGIVSVVSDTWDLFKLVTEYLPALKDRIMARPGKLVIRPDSGTPHKILNGDPEAMAETDRKGVVRLLDEVFGHTVTAKGYKVLDEHVGTIYGDGINSEELERILGGLTSNGYASNNVVIGLGSYTYQYVTRDTFGTVCKATYCEREDGTKIDMFKEPKTGGWKKSHKGKLAVHRDGAGKLVYKEQCDWAEEALGLLKPVFFEGALQREENLGVIRERLQNA